MKRRRLFAAAVIAADIALIILILLKNVGEYTLFGVARLFLSCLDVHRMGFNFMPDFRFQFSMPVSIDV